jgi:CRP-like cAMP-binding protein
MRSGSRVCILQADEALFRQGTRATTIFEVEQGRLRVIGQVDYRRVVLHTAKSGELFAEGALFVRDGTVGAPSSTPSLTSGLDRK